MSKPKAYTRQEVRSKYDELNKQEWRLEELYAHRMGLIAGQGGVDPRRRIEYAEGGMVQEDSRAMANCPTEFIHREYSKNSFYETGPINPATSLDDYED